MLKTRIACRAAAVPLALAFTLTACGGGGSSSDPISLGGDLLNQRLVLDEDNIAAFVEEVVPIILTMPAELEFGEGGTSGTPVVPGHAFYMDPANPYEDFATWDIAGPPVNCPHGGQVTEAVGSVTYGACIEIDEPSASETYTTEIDGVADLTLVLDDDWDEHRVLLLDRLQHDRTNQTLVITQVDRLIDANITVRENTTQEELRVTGDYYSFLSDQLDVNPPEITEFVIRDLQWQREGGEDGTLTEFSMRLGIAFDDQKGYVDIGPWPIDLDPTLDTSDACGATLGRIGIEAANSVTVQITFGGDADELIVNSSAFDNFAVDCAAW